MNNYEKIQNSSISRFAIEILHEAKHPCQYCELRTEWQCSCRDDERCLKGIRQWLLKETTKDE